MDNDTDVKIALTINTTIHLLTQVELVLLRNQLDLLINDTPTRFYPAPIYIVPTPTHPAPGYPPYIDYPITCSLDEYTTSDSNNTLELYYN